MENYWSQKKIEAYEDPVLLKKSTNSVTNVQVINQVERSVKSMLRIMLEKE